MRLRRRVLRWGNGYGIRITRRELERLGMQERQEAVVDIEPGTKDVDLTRLRFFHWGGDLSRRHDEAFEGDAGADR